MQHEKNVTLILDDGSRFQGKSFGYDKSVAGEVVFNTAMMGYPESLTDPSYVGQIMVLTYPLVGNYGVPSREEAPNGLSRFMESDRIHPEAIVVSDYSYEYSHWNAQCSLAEWLKEEKVVGVTGIDTRALTKLLREKGSMKGKIILEGDEDIPFVDPNLENLVARVSCPEVITYGEGEGKKRVVLIDCGVKDNIIRCLLNRGVAVTDSEIRPYIDDMPVVMAAADLVICRAGASTLGELTALGKPAILVPSPFVAANHQYKNAKVLADRGGAVLLEEKDCTGEKVYRTALELLSDGARRAAMGRALRKLSAPHAAQDIYRALESILRG